MREIDFGIFKFSGKKGSWFSSQRSPTSNQNLNLGKERNRENTELLKNGHFVTVDGSELGTHFCVKRE